MKRKKTHINQNKDLRNGIPDISQKDCTVSHVKRIKLFIRVTVDYVTLWGASVSLYVRGCQSENLFVCFGAKPPQRACTRDLPRDRKDEGRKVPETSRQERSDKRRTQPAEGSSRDQSTEQVSQEMRIGQRGEQSTEVREAAVKTC